MWTSYYRSQVIALREKIFNNERTFVAKSTAKLRRKCCVSIGSFEQGDSADLHMRRCCGVSLNALHATSLTVIGTSLSFQIENSTKTQNMQASVLASECLMCQC